LLTPCEVAVKTVSPAIRALLAQTLIDEHKLKETKVAEILGITQSAVSKYNKKVRGTAIHIENLSEIRPITNQMISHLLSNPVPRMEIMNLFCQVCRLIRSKGLMCPLCQQNQKPEINGCNFCNQH
jgi:predicted transcriptional regulator